jgi:dynamin GTPase
MRTLYYFKTPDDVPKPNGLRGQINLADCIIGAC